MTRINSGIMPAALVDQHLLAEWNELPRVAFLVLKAIENNRWPEIPETYRLGRGHVLFFYNKMLYLHYRFMTIFQEMKNRGFDPDYTWFYKHQDIVETITEARPEWVCDYRPTKAGHLIIRKRLIDKLSGSMEYRLRYYQKPIDLSLGIKLLYKYKLARI